MGESLYFFKLETNEILFNKKRITYIIYYATGTNGGLSIEVGETSSLDGYVGAENNGYKDAWIVASENGGIIWKITLGYLYDDVLYKIIRVSDGVYIGVGYSKGKYEVEQPTNFWIVKFVTP